MADSSDDKVEPTGEQGRPEVLELPDGYRTEVIVHRQAAGSGRLPVLYVHGIQSHPGWFGRSAAHLARRGHEVFQVTRRGSGPNRQDRGLARSANQLLADVAAAVAFVRQSTGAGRVHLLGVSWGGKLLTRFTAGRDDRQIASLTLVAPGIAAKVDVSPATKAKVGLAMLLCRRARFTIPLSEPELFTDNPQRQEYLRADPLRLHRATASFLFASRRLDRQLRQAQAGSIAAPTALILASRDRIIDNEATAAEIGRLTAGRAKVIELQGAHTLEFEPEPEPLLRALAGVLAAAEDSS